MITLDIVWVAVDFYNYCMAEDIKEKKAEKLDYYEVLENIDNPEYKKEAMAVINELIEEWS